MGKIISKINCKMNTSNTEIINTHAPQLKTPHFMIDHEFKSIEKPFPSVASYMVFVGTSRSGKSSLMTSLLTNLKMYYKAFHNVIIVIPKHSFKSMSEKDNPFIALSEEDITRI